MVVEGCVVLHRLQLLAVDLCLVGLSTLLALLLRDNFETSSTRLFAVAPYLAITLATAALTFPLLGTNRTIWRLSAMADDLRLLGAVLLTVVAAVVLGFGYNRLDGIARALPPLQGILMLVTLVGIRVAARLRHAARAKPTQFVPAATRGGAADTILLVAGSRLVDLYLRSVAELAPERVHIAGVLHPDPRQTGRLLQGLQILGTPGAVSKVLRDLEVQGQSINRIVVATALEKLLPADREALLGVEKLHDIRLELLVTSLGLDCVSGTDRVEPRQHDDSAFVIRDADLAAFAQRPYWRLKRGIDVLGAAILLVVSLPLLALAALLAAIDVGIPFIFSQYRPGVGGRPFQLYKFRTMAAARDSAGRIVPDHERTSAIGRFLRRTRLDELPQLVNILFGQMSFVGPRPLLPADQPPAYAARLLVRPGLTGWAQVKGGRGVSAGNKAALDVWYVMNASLALDLAILWHTARMILLGERIHPNAIRTAWRDLRHAGVCSSRLG
jgi:lipopolysaccharide/colanic/teichoic acid biosynthesis glycosyltransferase